MTDLLAALRPAERPPFEMALAFWREALARRLAPMPMQWLFLENLTLGHDRDLQDGATLCFQRIEPHFGPEDAREVYELAATEEAVLRFTPLVAAPEALFVTLTAGPDRQLQAVERSDWALGFDVEPAFHTFTEIDSLDEWARATRDGGSVAADLGGVLVGTLDPARITSS
jgi:hypothetical protein